MIDTIVFDAPKSMRRMDDNGYMHVALTPISKATVNGYYGREIGGEGLQPDKIYMGLRDPNELRDAAPTFNGLPLLMNHHPIDAETPAKEYVVGATGTDAMFDGTYLKNSLAVHDAEAIKMIEDESAKEISCAYRFRPDFTPGEFEINGTKIHYDFVMRDISGNHVALVPTGRAGHDVAVADSQPDGKEKKDMEEKVVFDSVDSVLAHFMPEMSEETKAEFKAALDSVTEPAAEVSEKAEEIAADEKAEEKTNEKAEEKPVADEKPVEDSIDENSPAYKAGFEAGKVVADSAVAEITEKAMADAKAQVKLLADAAEKVKPLCGTVDAMSFDSAADIYKFALEKAGKQPEKYDSAAYCGMVDMLLDSKPVFEAAPAETNDKFKVFENLRKIVKE